MKTRHIIVSGIIALTPVFAARAAVEWIDRDYNFGTWSEEEGIRQGRSLLVNNTDRPVLIRRVRPSCGCTGVDWPEDPIAPGDTAVISFSYNPEGRPGMFEKTIKVYLDDSTTPEIINLTGTVIGSDSSLRFRYPYKAGPLRLSQLSYDFGDVPYGQSRHAFISIYNTAGTPVTPALSRIAPGEFVLPVEVVLTPQTVEPGNTQSLSLFLNTRGAGLGRQSATQTICVGADCIDISITANVVPDTSAYTPAQLQSAPQCDVRPDVVETGDIRRGKNIKVEFNITNTGKSELEVKRIYCSRRDVKVKQYPVHLRPGRKGKVTVEIATASYPSEIMSDVIEIITNDPLRPVQSVRVVGYIK